MKSLPTRNERTSEHVMQTRTTLALLLAFLAFCLSGCGAIPDDIFNSDPDPNGANRSSIGSQLTVADYAVQCADLRAKPLRDYATTFDAVSDLSDMAEGLGAMSPPSEVAEMHMRGSR